MDKINELRTKRLILRRFNKDDLNDYYNILKQEKVSRWLGSGKRKNFDDVKNIMESFENHWVKNNYGVWAVIDKENNKLIGHCGVNHIGNTNDIELLYAFDSTSWGHGYATESARAVIEFIKSNTKLSKLVALAYPDNEKSCNVIEKLGFKYKREAEYFGVSLSYYELELNDY